ncbi:hypothetical protein SDJN02_12557, partial [Cucurbita argyrosperma subsp. argyrosperma]
MAISPFSLFILSIFFFSNFLITRSVSNTDTPLIHKTCNKIVRQDPNVSFNFCLTSLQFAIKHSYYVDLRRLGLLSIGLVCSNVTNTYHFITELIRNKNLDSSIKLCLVDCLELYSDAISTMKLAMRNYRLRRYNDANVAISAVMDAAETCENGFKEKKVNSPLKKRDEDVFELGAIVLAIMSMLH